tara:strand:- start:112 stop:957 length:846 start_codon:yes stop_codon:yes gene_type:complete
MRRIGRIGFGFLCFVSIVPIAAAARAETCGEVVTVAAHEGTQTRYSLAGPSSGARAALLLLPGGGGYLNLDDDGCPRKLKGNSLVRSRPLFHDGGMVTALVDAPDDYQGTEGLGGFRIDPAHAEDIGRVIADLRKRTGLPVWIVGTSRGGISAANAASRLSGPNAPDGVVMTSPVTSGKIGAAKPWVADTVFSLPLENVRMPILVVVHADDECVRTPPDLAAGIVEKTNGSREQVVTVTGGPGRSGGQSVEACKGKSAHGFLDQEAEVAAGVVRFVLGGAY